MKFGELLRSQKVPEWQSFYLDYDQLKRMIKELEEIHLSATPMDNSKATSLSIARPTNAAGMPVERQQISQEQFYAFMEQEMRKIEQFTGKQVIQIRSVLAEAERKINLTLSGITSRNETEIKSLQIQVEKAGEDFLQLEKFVNLNFMGFHKILKKHDRRLPNPCKAFYTARLHEASWVRGDYSDVMVTMSRVYSKLRGDKEVMEKENEKQDFVRSTRKYWVHTEDISAVKYSILQHLPVFLQKAMGGETDSQLVNSVYLDNHTMELYHGRLEKSPGAIALRFRWYGTGTPEIVFVERKTHRESWAGEVSVKERFIIHEHQVPSLLQGEFPLEEELTRLKNKGKMNEEDMKEWLLLVSEVIQAINSKQLVPTMRTQYMRTAFQIPFDATVRVSLDTNLTMISERTKDTIQGKRWYRDPNVIVPLTEITRFPHGVLEIKLQLQDESKTPEWVRELLTSGKLLEVHKFSKFIHGCAVLMPEDVRAVPYWIDDSTLADSIQMSGAGKLIEDSGGNGMGANQFYQHLLPHDATGKSKNSGSHSASSAGAAASGAVVAKIRPPSQLPRIVEDNTASANGAGNEADPSSLDYQQQQQQQWSGYQWCNGENAANNFCGGGNSYQDDGTGSGYCDWAASAEANHMTIQKVEPKLFFANERTFISWLQMAVMMSGIAMGVLAFSRSDGGAHDFAMLLLGVALFFIVYAIRTFLIRSEKIKTRDAERWDDPLGPVVLTVSLILALTVQFVLAWAKYIEMR